MTRDGVEGDDVATLAEMLGDNQSDLETHLPRALVGVYEAKVDPDDESPLPSGSSKIVMEPSAVTLLGMCVQTAIAGSRGHTGETS